MIYCKILQGINNMLSKRQIEENDFFKRCNLYAPENFIQNISSKISKDTENRINNLFALLMQRNCDYKKIVYWILINIIEQVLPTTKDIKNVEFIKKDDEYEFINKIAENINQINPIVLNTIQSVLESNNKLY